MKQKKLLKHMFCIKLNNNTKKKTEFQKIASSLNLEI